MLRYADHLAIPAMVSQILRFAQNDSEGHTLMRLRSPRVCAGNWYQLYGIHPHAISARGGRGIGAFDLDSQAVRTGS